MKKVKLTEQDLTNIVKKVIQEQENSNGEEIDDIINEFEKKYDNICYTISHMGLDELYENNSVQREIDENLSFLEGYDDERLSRLKSDFDDLSSKMNGIYYHLSNADSLKNSI